MKEVIIKLRSLFIKEIIPAATTKVVAIKGEIEPGYVAVDIGQFDAEGNFILNQVKHIKIKIHHKIRPTCNRVLAGIETEHDQQSFELFILSSPEAKF